MVLAGLAVLMPDLLHATTLHNPATGDQIDEIIPWRQLGWMQVHAGHLPLWNPYSLLGMPLAFNWQSAPFGLPALVGYALPLNLAFAGGIITTLVVAGTGVYVFGRVLGLGVVGSTAAATVFELSGQFLGWVGWPVASVLSWIGWILACACLLLAGRRRLTAGIGLALSVAAAVYAGQPDALVLLAGAVVAFVAVMLVLRLPVLGGRGPIGRPLRDIVVAGIAGAALSAPLLLPGLQVAQASIRSARQGSPAMPPHAAFGLLVPGFDGSTQHFFGVLDLTETSAYVGPIAIALACLGVWALRRSRAGRAVMVLGIAGAALAYVPPVTAVLNAMEGGVRWQRGVVFLDFALAIVAGAGAQRLVRRGVDRRARTLLLGGLGASGVVMAAVWVAGRGHLPKASADVRAWSFVWPAAMLVASLVAVVLLARHATRSGASTRALGPGRILAACLVALESVFLVHAGMPLQTSAPTIAALAPDPALVRIVQGNLVALGAQRCFPYSMGVLQDVNVVYRFRQFTVYDPMTPKAYYGTYKRLTGQSAQLGFKVVSALYCPAITSVDLARHYGIPYVLEPHGTALAGAELAGSTSSVDVYRVPGAGPATLTPLEAGGRIPAPDAQATPVPVTYPGPASWRVVTDAPSASVLRLHLTASPGWRATIDGRPLQLQKYAEVMLQARVPAGHHVVALHYRPGTFTAGIALAAVSALGLVGVCGVAALRRRRVRPEPTPPAGD